MKDDIPSKIEPLRQSCPVCRNAMTLARTDRVHDHTVELRFFRCEKCGHRLMDRIDVF